MDFVVRHDDRWTSCYLLQVAEAAVLGEAQWLDRSIGGPVDHQEHHSGIVADGHPEG